MSTLLKRSFLVLGVAALSLGGCNNNKLKSENEQLRTQATELQSTNDELKTKLAESDAQRAQALAESQAKAAENARLQQEVMTARTTTTAYPPAGGNSGNWNNNGGGGSGGKRGGSESGGNGGGDVIDVITVAGDVLFAPGQANLSSEGKRELDQVARTIKNKYSGHGVRVEGYTDSDPIKHSKWGTNKALSQARADAVEKYLMSKGISNSRISAVGMGSSNAKGTKAASRRVEIKILG